MLKDFFAGLVIAGCALSAMADFRVYPADSFALIDPQGNNLDFTVRDQVALDLAGNEAESFQLVLVSDSAQEQKININVTPFNASGLKVEYYQVGYVKTGNPSYAVDRVGLWPDPLFPVKEVNLTRDQVKTIFFNVKANDQVAPGTYRTKITLSSANVTKDFYLQVKVRDFVLPFPGKLKVPVGLFADALGDWYDNSPKYFGKFKQSDYNKWVQILVENRMSPKEIGVEYGIDAAAGSKTLDCSPLLNSVKVYDSQMTPGSYHFYRLPSGVTVRRRMNEGKTGFNLITGIPPKEYLEQWKKLGLPINHTYMYGVDEPEPSDKELALKLKEMYTEVKKEMPEVRIMQTTGTPRPELVGLVSIWCPKTSTGFHSFFQERVRAGDELWLYFACSPISPASNMDVDTPSLDKRILIWQVMKANATGFLYWAATWYRGMPKPTEIGNKAYPEFNTWDIKAQEFYWAAWLHVNGDGIILYPGPDRQPYPSIRLFVLRDGIEDYEYVQLLKKYLAEVQKLPLYKTPAGKNLIDRARELCKVPDDIVVDAFTYTRNPTRIMEQRRHIADMIEQLKQVLEKKEYLKWGNRNA